MDEQSLIGGVLTLAGALDVIIFGLLMSRLPPIARLSLTTAGAVMIVVGILIYSGVIQL